MLLLIVIGHGLGEKLHEGLRSHRNDHVFLHNTGQIPPKQLPNKINDRNNYHHQSEHHAITPNSINIQAERECLHQRHDYGISSWIHGGKDNANEGDPENGLRGTEVLIEREEGILFRLVFLVCFFFLALL